MRLPAAVFTKLSHVQVRGSSKTLPCLVSRLLSLTTVSSHQPTGPLVDPLGKIVNIEHIRKNGPME